MTSKAVADKKNKQATENVKEDYILQVKNLKKHFPIKAGILQRTVNHVKV